MPRSDASKTIFNYRTIPGGVSVSNTYKQSDASIDLAVENYQYEQNYAGTPQDLFTLRLMAGANTRVMHTYSIGAYGDPYYDCPGYSNNCADSGISSANMGKWFSLGFKYYFWGTFYSQIFVCSNGWAAFSYSGDPNNCPAGPQSIPTPDTLGTEVPESIIAPLWKPLDPSSSTGTGGTIRTYQYCSPANDCWFGVIWKNVMTQNDKTACSSGPCINTFSFVFDNQYGAVQFAYGQVASDQYRATIGLEDPSGYHAVIPDYSTTISQGANMHDPNYGCNCDVWDSKINFDKLSTTDGATVLHTQNFLQGLNIVTANPPPPPSPNPLDETVAQIAENAFWTGACYLTGIGDAWCFGVQTGATVLGSVVRWLNPVPNPPAYTASDITDPTVQTGYVEMPIVDQNAKLLMSDEEMVFDVIQWYVPHTPGIVHNLSIQYQVQLGSGGPWRSTSVQLTVDPGDFSVSATQPSNIGPGDFTTSTVTVSSTNNLADVASFRTTVSPAVPNAPTVTFSPSAVSVPAGGAATSVMTISTTPSTPMYPYNVTVTAQDPTGAVTHSKSVTFTVAPDFSIRSSANYVNIQQGGSAQTSINLASLGGFSGTVTLSTSAPSGITMSLASSSIPLSSGGTGSTILTIGTISSDSIGNYVVSVTGTSGSSSHTASITVAISNFYIAATPASISTPVAGTGSVTVTAYSQNGYSGPVSLIVTGGLPSCVTYSFNPSTLQLPAGGTASSTLALNPTTSCSTGTNNVSVQGNSGSWGYAIGFTLAITDFAISPNSPTSYNCYVGNWCKTLGGGVTVTAANGFTGSVSLTSNPSSGLSVYLPSPTATLTTTTTSANTDTWVYSNSVGTYTFTVTGSSGSLSHTTAAVTIQQGDFNISVTPSSLTVPESTSPGPTGSATITVTSLGWFNVNVALSVQGPPDILGMSLSASPVSPPSGGSADGIRLPTGAASTT